MGQRLINLQNKTFYSFFHIHSHHTRSMSTRTIRITIQALTGKTYNFDMKPEQTVADLKRMISLKGPPVSQQKLVLKSTELLDNDKIENCSITPISVIHLLPSMTSGNKLTHKIDPNAEVPETFDVFIGPDDLEEFTEIAVDQEMFDLNNESNSPCSNFQKIDLTPNPKHSFIYVFIPQDHTSGPTSLTLHYDASQISINTSEQKPQFETKKPSGKLSPKAKVENDKTKTTMSELRKAINDQKRQRLQHRSKRSNRLKSALSDPTIDCSCIQRNNNKQFIQQSHSTEHNFGHQQLPQVQPNRRIAKMKCGECKVILRSDQNRIKHFCRCGNLYCCLHINPEQHDCDSSYSAIETD